MKTFEPVPPPPLEPALAQLIDRGILSRLEEETLAFVAQVTLAVSDGAVTPSQARTLGQMLGVRAPA